MTNKLEWMCKIRTFFSGGLLQNSTVSFTLHVTKQQPEHLGVDDWGSGGRKTDGEKLLLACLFSSRTGQTHETPGLMGNAVHNLRKMRLFNNITVLRYYR